MAHFRKLLNDPGGGRGVGKKFQEGMMGWVGVKKNFFGIFSLEEIMAFYTFRPHFLQFFAVFASQVVSFHSK